ncbi:mind the gap isoform X1 [Anticarsia gemmatalis]|uniref:mind the gap isoform X1 n=1 Tax=Anticarsia gemmatalis TaxID=129554 RepID=UPI003F770D15
MKATVLLGGCLVLLAVLIEIAHPTCVLESDFGFKINCAFKKSGLFRVRNLGGVKAHASIGFSLGDELGFEQSLTNLDPSRRRSVSVRNGAPANVLAARPAKQEKRGKQNRIMRPVAPVNRPNQAAMDKLTSLHRRVSTTMQPIIVQAPVEQTIAKPVPTVTMAKPMPMGVPPFKPLPPKDEKLAVIPIQATRKTYTPLQIPQSKGPGLAYQSEQYPSHNQISKMVSQMTAQQYSPIRITPTPIIVDPQLFSKTTVNPFVPMPPSQAISVIQAPVYKEIHTQPTYTRPYLPNSLSIQKNPLSNFVDPVPHQVHDLAVYNTKKVDDYNSITGYGDDTVLKINKEDINAKIAEIAKAGNISMEAVEAAIALRQQQLLSKYANIPVPTAKPTTTTTTTTTEQPQPFVFQPEPEPEILTAALPQKPKRVPVAGKVMNAPREYYPVGYEKNFDDHFQSKVELPETNFHCGDQKYFPGLYGDESLGCMVFHVCALTDDGLVMKSFLCPESTLFDQTILKCNWWFYVDCKNTKKLYDTNIPVSKSYQLMKALTFFSSYKKEMQDGQQKPNPEEVDGIKEAISILQNAQPNAQANQPQPSIANIGNGANNVANVGSNANIQTVQFVTPTPLIDERSRQTTTESAPVYRGTRNYDATKNKNTTSAENVQDIKLITVNADINIQNNTENDSREKKHRRRMTLKSTNTITKATTQKPVPSIVEVIKQEIQPIESLPKQEKLTDQIENLNPNTANLAPVRRFYRSSAEKFEEKEMAVVNNEKVQIVRPTAQTRLVGEYPTPSAVIAKLDEAILGKVRTRKHITIVMPLDSPKT